MATTAATAVWVRRVSRAAVVVVLAGAWLIAVGAPAGAVTATWDGDAADDNWTTGANWQGDAPPSAGDDLVFPDAGAVSPVNDFAPGTAFASISFSGAAGTNNLVGNGVVVNNVSGVNTSGNNSISLPIALSGPGTFTATNAGGNLDYGPITIGAHTLAFTGSGRHTVNGIITGSGSITKSGSGLLALGGPAVGQTWTSTVTGGPLAVLGNQPANVVTVNGGELHGFGTVGGIVGTAGALRPGGPSAGALSVDGNVALTGGLTYFVQLNGMAPGTQFDQLLVTGSVDLGGAQLNLAPSFLPPTNQQLVIVANDGGDPVAGTFGGLADGTTFTAGPGSRTYRIEYDGGDGNDVSLTRLDEKWDGSAGDGRWATGANWADGSAPTDGDSLMFGALGVGALVNDAPVGLDVAFAGFNVGGYTVTGNAVDLAGGLWASHPGSTTTDWGPPTKVTAAQSWETISGARLRVSGPVTLQAPLTLAGDGLTAVSGVISSTASEGLAKNGSGAVVLAADNAVTGPTTVNAGTLTVSGDLAESSITVAGGVLNGSGTVGSVHLAAGTLDAGNSAGTHGILTAGGLTFESAATFAPELDGTTAGVTYDQVAVAGAFDPGGATLALDVGFTPNPGHAFTIVEVGGGSPFVGGEKGTGRIDDPANGAATFASLPEGAVFGAGGSTFSITYAGGDGDDVVVTAQGATTTTTTAPTTTSAPATTTTTAPATTTTTAPATTTTSAPTTTTSTGPATGTTTGSGGDLPTTGSGEGMLRGARLAAWGVLIGSLLVAAGWAHRRRQVRRVRV